MLSILVNRVTLGLLSLILAMLLIWQLSTPVGAQVQPQGSSVSAPKTIVLIYSYGDGLLAYQQATRAFLSSMEGGVKEGIVSEKSLFFEYLDLERKKDKEHYKNLTTLLLHKYTTQKIDLIVTVHGPALKFLLNEGRDLSPGTPVLSYLGPDRIETTGIERRFVLLPMSMDFRGTLQLAQKLFPQTTRVVFVNGIGEGEKRLEREAKSVFAQWPDKLEFEYTSDLSVEEMLQRIATLSPGTIVIYSNVFTDKTGRNFVAREVAEMVAKAANVPVFGMYNTLLGRGIIGGSVFNFEAEGARAGMLALDILRGKLLLSKPTTIFPASRTPMFDWEQLKPWGVKENRLPPGSIVLNRPKTLWSEYKGLFIVGIAVFLAQTVLVIGLLIQRRRKKVAEEELNQFFNVGLDLKCIANTEGYFLRLNPAWERILGYTREELMAKRFLEFVHPEDLERTREAISSLASQQTLTSFENRYRCKDGTYRWLEWSSAPAGNLIYAAARDVTERKQAEEVLQERLKFESLLAEISMHFVNLPADQIDSELEDAQRRICELLDLDRATLWQVGEGGPGTLLLTHFCQPPGSLPPPERMNAMDFIPWAAQKVLNGETVTFSKLTDLPPEAGRDRETLRTYGTKSDVAVPLSVGKGPVFGMLTFAVMREERNWPGTVLMGFKLIAQVFANALARKRAEAEAFQARRELLQLDRLSRMGELTASLAHELNQPLAAILSNAQAGLRFLQSGKIDPDEVRDILQDIIQDDQRAGNVIRSLRSMVRREEVERNPIILNHVLNDVIEIFHTESIFRNVHVETEFDGSLPPVLGDKVQLQQVTLNLILNAADAMSHNPPEQRQIILRTGVKDDRIRVTVRDFGPGINKGDLERIFESFFTTKRTGLGMGLAVCRTIVEAHEGRIWAENNPDGGATFVFEMPISGTSGK